MNQEALISLGDNASYARVACNLLQDIYQAQHSIDYEVLIESLAEEIAEIVEARMRGLIKHKVINPITSHAVQYGVSKLVDWARDHPLLQTDEEKQAAAIKKYLADQNRRISGVAAGDGYIDEEEIKGKKGEGELKGDAGNDELKRDSAEEKKAEDPEIIVDGKGVPGSEGWKKEDGDYNKLHKNLAIFSSLSYSENKFQNVIKKAKNLGCDNVIRSDPSNYDNKGYKATAFISEDYIAIASRGTENSSDVRIDAGLLFGTTPKQFKEAENFYKKIKALYPTKQIIFTGHSLGGYYSEMLFLKYGEKCVTFDSPGSRKFRKYQDKKAMRCNINEDLILYKAPDNLINSSLSQLSNNICRVKVPSKLKITNHTDMLDIYNETKHLHNMENIIQYWSD